MVKLNELREREREKTGSADLKEVRARCRGACGA